MEGDRRVHVRLHRLRLLLADGVRPGQHPHGRHHRRRGERPQERNEVHVYDVRIHQDVVRQSTSIFTSLRFHLSPIPFCFFQKMLEVQQQQQQPASRCLRHNSTAAGSGGNNNQQQPMIRSQSMMATGSSSSAGSCHSHPQQPRCRQHHAAEIHHLDDGQPQPQRERLLVPQQSGRGPRHPGASNTSSTLSICPLLPPPSMDEAHFLGDGRRIMRRPISYDAVPCSLALDV